MENEWNKRKMFERFLSLLRTILTEQPKKLLSTICNFSQFEVITFTQNAAQGSRFPFYQLISEIYLEITK